MYFILWMTFAMIFIKIENQEKQYLQLLKFVAFTGKKIG